MLLNIFAKTCLVGVPQSCNITAFLFQEEEERQRKEQQRLAKLTRQNRALKLHIHKYEVRFLFASSNEWN